MLLNDIRSDIEDTLINDVCPFLSRVSLSWATSFTGESDDSRITIDQMERLIGEHTLRKVDAIGINNSEEALIGLGLQLLQKY